MRKILITALALLLSGVLRAPGRFTPHPPQGGAETPEVLPPKPPKGGAENPVYMEVRNWLHSAELNEENLRMAVELEEIIAPDIIVCQGRLETGNFKSVLCREYNNLFGMRLAHVRATTALGETENGYAVYSSWYDCVRDMRLFQEWYERRGYRLEGDPPAPLKGGECRESYVTYMLFLSAIGYAEDPGYIEKLSLLCCL